MAVEIIFGVIIMVFSVALIAMVLLQSGKDKRLSGTIAGAAETFFAKGKSKTRDKILARATTVLAFLLVIVAAVFFIYLCATK